MSVAHRWVIVVLVFVVGKRLLQGLGRQCNAMADKPCQISAQRNSYH